jgi:hypothetical protein
MNDSGPGPTAMADRSGRPPRGGPLAAAAAVAALAVLTGCGATPAPATTAARVTPGPPAGGPGRASLAQVEQPVIRYPPRSAAEYLVAARFRSVRITALPSSAAVTSTSPGLIRQVVHLVNTAQATAQLPFSCPLITELYSIVITPAAAGQPKVDLDLSGCGTVRVQVGGHAQPTLYDNGLERLAFELLHLKLMPPGAVMLVPTVLRHVPGRSLVTTQVPRPAKPAAG